MLFLPKLWSHLSLTEMEFGMASVLVVDDTPDSLDLLSRLLRICGHTVQCARDGHEALDALSRSHPDKIILDMMMPGMDGVDFLRVMRRNPEWKDIHVIVFTGCGDQHRTKELATLGVTGIFQKGSSDIESLLKLVA